jgi:hypothetical protein
MGELVELLHLIASSNEPVRGADVLSFVKICVPTDGDHESRYRKPGA